VVLAFAALSGSFGNNWTVEYTVPKPATLITGQEFCKALKVPGNSSASYYTFDNNVKSITFDYYGSKYNDVVNNASVVTDVATSDSEEDALMYHIGDSTNGYDVYVLSKGNIMANTNSSYMFNSCGICTTLDANNLDTSNVTNMDWMFESCYCLVSIVVGCGWNTSVVTDSRDMFLNCYSVVGQNGTVYNSSYVDKTYACLDTTNSPGYLCGTLILPSDGLAYAGIINHYVKKAGSVVFDYYTSLNSYLVDNINVIDGIVGVDVSVPKDGSIMLYKVGGTRYILSDNLIIANNAIYMFGGCTNLTNITFNNLDTSRVNSMYYMFCNCSELRTLDLCNFDTSNVTNMSRMFEGCTRLTDLNVEDFDTSSVTSMRGMFRSCRMLSTLELSNFDTSNVTDMTYMFDSCQGLTTLHLSSFDTSSVTSMDSMFQDCSGLSTLDLSSFDTSSVTNMDSMFDDCKKLSTIDVSSFDTSSVTNMYYMFYNCSGLKTIYRGSKWSTASVTSGTNMFYGCTSLPNYSSSYVTHAYYTRYMTLKS